MKTLELLSEALPLALAHVGSCPIEVQVNFWRSFHEFDRKTDVTSAPGKDDKDPDMGTAIGMLLEDWREVVELRISQPAGALATAPDVPERR